jgi:hypothetical protein
MHIQNGTASVDMFCILITHIMCKVDKPEGHIPVASSSNFVCNLVF